MYSSRRSSVGRHIQRLHQGDGISIPFADYVAGIRNGYYPSANRPTFKGTKSSHVLEDEFEKEIAKRSVKKVLDTLPSAIVDDVVNSSIPALLSSPKFRSSSTPGLNNITKFYVGKANFKLSDQIFGLSQSFCEVCGLILKTAIEYGDAIKASGLRHPNCKEKQKILYSDTGSLVNYQNHPDLRFLKNRRFKSQILEWTFDSCALLTINLGNLLRDTIVSMGGSCGRYVLLNSKTESIVSLTELDLVNYDWLDLAIESGWTNMEEEDLDQFLNIVPNNTWFYLKLSQQGKEHYYFVMLFYLFVKERPQIAPIPQ